jgi:hypothetical protein
MHVDTAAVVQAEVIAPIGLVEIMFDSGPVRLWTGVGELAWEGNAFTGAGDGGATGRGQIGKISAIEETSELRAVGMTLELSACDPQVLAIANNEDWQGRPVQVWYAALRGRALVGQPLRIFKGIVDTMRLIEGAEASALLGCESKQIDLERTLARRWTAEQQRADYPGDKGCDAVAALQDTQLKWGRE